MTIKKSLTVLLSLALVESAYAPAAYATDTVSAPKAADVKADAKKTDTKVIDLKSADPVVAKVLGQEIKKSALEKRLADLKKETEKAGSKDSPMIKDFFDDKNKSQALAKILDMEIEALILKDAIEKVKKTSDFKKALEAMTERLAEQQLLTQEADKLITDSEIKAKYEEIIKNRAAEDQVYISVVQTDDEAKAKDAHARITKGEDFGKVAKELSNDEFTKNDGGAIKTAVHKGTPFPDDLKAAVFSTSVGKLCDKPVKVEFEVKNVDGKSEKKPQFIVFKVTKREPIPAPTLDKSKDAVKGLLREGKVADVRKKLRDSAKVEIFKIAE